MLAAMSAITIRAAVLERPGAEPRIEELTLDEPRAGEVRVRMAASGVCHSDLHVRDGEWERPGPIVMGHEGAGIVEAVGPGVDPAATGLAVGRLVALSWLVPCGALPVVSSRAASGSARCRRRTRHRMPDGTSRLRRARDGGEVLSYCAIGTMAEAQVVPAAAAIPMPDGTPPEVAALIGCCVATGVGAVTKTLPVEPGSSVAVIGLGGVGLSAVMGAALAGAARVVAVDRVAAKLDLARGRRGDRTASWRATTRLRPPRRSATRPTAAPTSASRRSGCRRRSSSRSAACRRAARALLVGMTPFGAAGVVRGLPVRRRRRGGSSARTTARPIPAVDFPRYAALHLEGRLPVDRLVTERIGLDDVEPAFERMRRGEGVRSVISFDRPPRVSRRA